MQPLDDQDFIANFLLEVQQEAENASAELQAHPTYSPAVIQAEYQTAPYTLPTTQLYTHTLDVSSVPDPFWEATFPDWTAAALQTVPPQTFSFPQTLQLVPPFTPPTPLTPSVPSQRQESKQKQLTPPPVPCPPRKREARRKKTVEQPGICLECGNTLALFNIRGDTTLLDSGLVIEILCAQCAGANASHGGPTMNRSLYPSIGRKRGRSQMVDCEICKEMLGCGRVRTLADDEVELEITVEAVCLNCKGKYGFCGSCGGGGKYRTGKYRPIELFPKNRKTCLLSHVRVGNARLHYQVYTGADLPLDQLELLSEVYHDAFLALYATPKVMHEVPAFATFVGLNNFLRAAWSDALADILRPATPTSTSIWYCAAGWIINPPRKKGKSTRHVLFDSQDTSSEDSGLNSPPSDTGTYAADPQKYNVWAGKASQSPQQQPQCNPTERCYVGVCASEHQLPTNSIYLAEVGVMQSVQSQGIAQELILRTLNRIQSESFTPIRYVWLLTRRINLPMQRFSEKCGFMLKDLFERTYPECVDDVRWFVREGYDMNEYITYVAKVDQVQSRARGRQAFDGDG
ncbi:uncharacterized protein SPPG_02234 [Spizellomyces punctatus DAOM BR117]|uniref:N-acetyltransferase domain-containing protein n=1 Tax=Spizellomyces punctatus (strain DAOM BR117) TaxID=645134 RepID=A0A0L0HQ01_SPIPD|nr:uncharacterized protein SPPG_02234 [Spizellomyces punctatus DAOM BR117]KND03172.1 hypothetical protein SPPG_02234 [Spizellomyces punctatus DAOM BR117]|eukprot:XP_016611211.1 hypothetical protein SPPG_02234 [Spizellomyces punctatus DAOM BR117]